MLPELEQLGPITLRTYTILIDLAILVGLGALTLQGWRLDDEPVAWLDVGLWSLVGGMMGGRVLHVLIHWQYFSDHLAEIPAIWQGGINWHGAVVFGLGAAVLACARLNVSFRDLTDTLAVVLPVGAALAYGGCLASGCGHGQEVPTLAGYPPYIAAELPDLYGIVAPRFQTQLFGIALSVLLLLVALGLMQIPSLIGLRLWFVLLGLGLGAFAIDFTRGDAMPLIGSLRLDQYLDLAVALIGVGGLLTSRRYLWPRPLAPRSHSGER